MYISFCSLILLFTSAITINGQEGEFPTRINTKNEALLAQLQKQLAQNAKTHTVADKEQEIKKNDDISHGIDEDVDKTPGTLKDLVRGQENERKVAKTKQTGERAFSPQDLEKMMDQVLKSKEKTQELVDCILEFDPESCPEELERISRRAPQIFRRAGRCYKCPKAERNLIRKFMARIQTDHTDEFNRLVDGLGR